MTQTLTGEFIIHNTKEANLELTFKLSNDTDKTVHVCKYGTPLEGLVGSGHIIFTDVATNQVARYQGLWLVEWRPLYRMEHTKQCHKMALLYTSKRFVRLR
jgi:hypothetical protein